MPILEKIVENKRAEVAVAKRNHPIETLREAAEASSRDFRAALAGGRAADSPKLIAEVKRKSPSQKSIRENLRVAEIVEIYNQYASAISVLTDAKFFGGSLEDLDEANYTTRVPLLRKDFILDEYQLLEARVFGADAVLLIAKILEIDELNNMLSEAKKLGLDCLVEIHSGADLEKVLQTDAEIIGINNRNLDTLEIDLETTLQLAEKIPPEKIIVSESGISDQKDVGKLKGKVDAILVGSSILAAEDIEVKLAEITR